jgi:hypothetical protein
MNECGSKFYPSKSSFHNPFEAMETQHFFIGIKVVEKLSIKKGAVQSSSPFLKNV